MVAGLTVDAALTHLRRLQLQWPDGRIAHAWPAEWVVDSVLFAPFGSRQTVVVRIRAVHRLRRNDVIEIEVAALCLDPGVSERVHTDQLGLVTSIALQVADQLDVRSHERDEAHVTRAPLTLA